MGRPIWKGRRDLMERPESPEIYNSATEGVVIRRFEGPYDACMAGRAKVGSLMAGYGVTTIEDCRVTRLPGGRGQLTITGKNKGDTVENPPNPEPEYEVDWVRVTKKIEQHPFFAELTKKDIREVKNAVEAASSNPETEPSFTSATAQKLYEKLLRGQDSYDVWAPLIRMTREYNAKPATGNCGMRSEPPIDVGGDWVYLKTADSARRQNRKWTRTEEWTGADQIDEDIYP